MTAPKAPNPDVFYRLHDEGHPNAYALKRAGYSTLTPAAVRAAASKLLTRRAPQIGAPATAYGADHPAVMELSPDLRVKWDSLDPAIRAWYLATSVDKATITPQDKDRRSLLDIPGDIKMLLGLPLTGDFAKGGPWQKAIEKWQADQVEKAKVNREKA